MQIRPVDVSADTDLHEFHQVLEASRRLERPYAVLWSEQEAAVAFRSPDDSERDEAFAVVDGGAMVGVGVFTLPLLDNLDKVYFSRRGGPASCGLPGHDRLRRPARGAPYVVRRAPQPARARRADR